MKYCAKIETELYNAIGNYNWKDGGVLFDLNAIITSFKHYNLSLTEFELN